MLRISLKDGEKIVINGAVLRSAGRTDIVLENDASVLRGRDVMAPDEADTPARRLYFACMLAYLDPPNIAQHRGHVLELLDGLIHALEAPSAKAACARFASRIAASDFYRALADCREIIAYEAHALGRLIPADAA